MTGEPQMLQYSISTMVRTWTLVAVLSLCVVLGAAAEDGWGLTLGGGAYVSNVYSGADEFFLSPLPVARASYKSGKVEVFASTLDGLGFLYVDMEGHLFASAGVNLGERRDSEEYDAIFVRMDHRADTARYLAGTPTAWNPAYGFGMLGWISPIGIFASALYYQPTLLSGDADELFHAFIPSLFYLAPVQVTEKFKLTTLLSLDFMDSRYAEAWYSVEEATGELEEFHAEAGLRGVQLILQAEYFLTEHVSVGALASNLYLLKDAADSPYTRSPYRLKAGLYLAYTF